MQMPAEPSPGPGQFWFDSNTNQIKVSMNGQWVNASFDAQGRAMLITDGANHALLQTHKPNWRLGLEEEEEEPPSQDEIDAAIESIKKAAQ